MEIKKIKLIEMPKTKFTLSQADMSALMGGTTCTSFDSCSSSRKNNCGSYESAGLCGGSTDKLDVKCATYSF